MLYFGTYHRLRVHVSATPKEVLRALYKKLKPVALSREQRPHRHAIARDILECHREARSIFTKYRF
jgi:hypothetical protein